MAANILDGMLVQLPAVASTH